MAYKTKEVSYEKTKVIGSDQDKTDDLEVDSMVSDSYEDMEENN